MKNKKKLKQTSISIKAPIILDAITMEGVKPLLDLVETIKKHSNVEIAEQEKRRLSTYFRRFSRHLKKAIRKTKRGGNHNIKKLATSENLSRLFTAIAAATRNTLLSEVVIAPNNLDQGPAGSIFTGMEFPAHFLHNGYTFKFTFLQVHQGTRSRLCSTVMPVLKIDSRITDAISPYRPIPLLKNLQAVMTLVNHDMLHHFTAPYIDQFIVTTFNHDAQTAFRDWSEKIPYTGSGEAYEYWAHISHEKILQPDKSRQIAKKVISHIDRYFDELKRIGADIQKASENKKTGEETSHKVVDFLGILMAHALTRVFPLNHTVIKHCLSRMEDADPLPGQAVADFYYARQENEYQSRIQPLSMADIRDVFSYFGTGRTVDDYQRLGLCLFPKRLTYPNIQLLNLITIASKDITAHIPSPSDPRLSTLRNTTDRLTLDMLRIAAQTAKFDPS